MLSAIILAAGTSSRMGANKLLLPYQGRPLLLTTIDNVLSEAPDEIILVTGHESEKLMPLIRDLPLRIVHNPHYMLGMTSSIQQGVSSATGNGYMICLGDMVNITGDEYTLISGQFKNNLIADPSCICVPVHEGRQGNPVIFSAAYRQAILSHDEPEGCKGILKANPTHIHRIIMPSPHIFQDIDEPADYVNLH